MSFYQNKVRPIYSLNCLFLGIFSMKFLASWHFQFQNESWHDCPCWKNRIMMVIYCFLDDDGVEKVAIYQLTTLKWISKVYYLRSVYSRNVDNSCLPRWETDIVLKCLVKAWQMNWDYQVGWHVLNVRLRKSFYCSISTSLETNFLLQNSEANQLIEIFYQSIFMSKTKGTHYTWFCTKQRLFKLSI